MRVQTHPQHFNPHLLLLLKLNTEEESPDTPSTFQSSPSDIINSKHSRRESRHLHHLNPHPSVRTASCSAGFCIMQYWGSPLCKAVYCIMQFGGNQLCKAVLGSSIVQSCVLHHILLGVSNALGTGWWVLHHEVFFYGAVLSTTPLISWGLNCAKLCNEPCSTGGLHFEKPGTAPCSTWGLHCAELLVSIVQSWVLHYGWSMVQY